VNAGVFRWGFGCALALLIGCTPGKPDPAPFVAPQLPKETVADKAGDLDARSMSFAAAAATVAKEAIAAGKPKVAERELDVVLANLVRPDAAHLQSAKRRASEGKDETYAKHVQKAEELQKKSDEAWAAVEAEKAKNHLLQKQIDAERQARLDADKAKVKADTARDCRIAGGVFALLAVIAIWADKYLLGGVLVAGASLAVALPLFIDEVIAWPHWPLALGSAAGLAVVVGLLVWFLSRRRREEAPTQEG
jgi:hypothetical protein